MPVRTSLKGRVTKLLYGALNKVGIAKSRDKEQRPSAVLHAALKPHGLGVAGLDQALAEEFADDLKRIIEQQAFAWVPLSSGYARKKQMLGQDPRILIATGAYVNAIQAVQTATGDWEVAVPATPLPNSSKHTLRDLAMWLEFGTQHMPARPHWRPALALWKTKTYRAKAQLKHATATYLRRRGFR